MIPATKEVIETKQHFIKQHSHFVLKNSPLSNSTVKRRIDEMPDDGQNRLVLEIRNRKLSLQLDQSTFGSPDLLMVYLRYYSRSQKGIIDKFFFARYLEADAKGETILHVVQ